MVARATETHMKVTYETTCSAVCPVDENVIDMYGVTIVTDGFFLTVEEINEQIRELTQSPVFQESLTQMLHDTLAVDDDGIIEVTLKGFHSGVTVTATA